MIITDQNLSLQKCWKLVLSYLNLYTHSYSSYEMRNQEAHNRVPCIQLISYPTMHQDNFKVTTPYRGGLCVCGGGGGGVGL